MRVRILARQAGAPGEPGEEREVGDDEARRLVDSGRAEPVAARRVVRERGGRAVETASVLPPAETRGG